MTDPTEDIRKADDRRDQRPTRLQGVPGSPSTGRSGTPAQLSEDFDVIGFMAPRSSFAARATGRRGASTSRRYARFYFGFEPHRP